jgi:hypothetical protein
MNKNVIMSSAFPVLLILGALPAFALDGGFQPKPVEASRDFLLSANQEPPMAEFGLPFDFVIKVKHTRDYQIQFPKEFPLQDNLRALGPFKHLTSIEKTDGGSGLIEEEWRISLIALDTEKIDTPQIEAITNMDEPLLIDPMAIMLKPIPPPAKDDEKKEGFESNAGPFVFFVPDDRPYILGSFASTSLVCLLLFLFLMLKRRLPQPPQPQEELLEKEPEIPPHLIALERLEELMQRGLLEKGEVKTFVTYLMNDVLRSYLEARYDFPAEKRTTRELVADLLKISDAGLDVQLMKDILETTDLVKFANAAIPPQNAHTFANQVKTLILKTKQELKVGDA